MAELLEVPTHFADVNGLVQYLALRVKNEALWLAASRNLGSGDWVRFIVRLSDGQSVLEGVGRCTTSTPNLATDGVFDVVLDALQFDPRNEIMFERILIASETLSSGKEGTRPVSLSEVDIAVAGVPVDGASYDFDVDLDDEAPMPLSPLSIKNRQSKRREPTTSSAPPPLPGSRAPGRMRPAVKGRPANQSKATGGDRARRRSSQQLPKAPVRQSRRTEALGSAEDPIAKKQRLADEHRKRSERFERMQREKREAEKREREEQRRQLQEAKRERERELAELKRERERKKEERKARRRSRPSQAKRASERSLPSAAKGSAPIEPEITRSGKKKRAREERTREETPPTYETPSHAPGRFAPDEFDLEATQVGTALEDIEAMRASPFPQTEPPAARPAPEPKPDPKPEPKPKPTSERQTSKPTSEPKRETPSSKPPRRKGTDTSVALPTQPEEEVMLSLELDQKLDQMFHVLQERGVVATREDALILALKIGLGALSAEYE